MAPWLIVILFSVGAVLLFAVGLSLTLMIKGHHIDSEIATNSHMRARGITCPAADGRRTASGRRDFDGRAGDTIADCVDLDCSDCASCAKK